MSPSSKPKLSQVLNELKADYLESFPKKISVLRDLTQKKKWDELREEYHKLKGSGKTYGFPEISVISEKLELLASQKPLSNLQIFPDAVLLVERMHQSYLEGKTFDLEKDPFARSLLALNLN